MAENLLTDKLSTEDGFVITLEYTVPDVSEPVDGVDDLAKFAAGDARIAAVALTDRVPGMRTHDPIDLAVRARDISGKMPMVHMSGKNRDRFSMQAQIDRLMALGLSNCLLLTGDMPRVDLPDPMVQAPQGYIDAVQAIDIARGTSESMFIAAAVSTFKYTEPTVMMQYHKLRGKIKHGANAIFNQVGYDMRKLQELPVYLKSAGIKTPAVAALYWLTAAFGRFANRGEVPGVVITDDVVSWLEEISSSPDKGKQIRMELLALQIVLARAWGYRGVHIGGFKKTGTLRAVLALADKLWQEGNAQSWWAAWNQLMKFSDGRAVQTGLEYGFYLFESDGNGLNSDRQISLGSAAGPGLKYHVMDVFHSLFFGTAMEKGHWMQKISTLMGKLSVSEYIYYHFEHMGKWPLVGCEGCGSCSLPETLYVCTEYSCAKKLPDGPCGGPRLDNRCEVRPERDCAYIEIYRRAKAISAFQQMLEDYVPAKDRSLRHTSSWVTMANGTDHRKG